MVDTWTSSHFARPLLDWLKKTVDAALPIHEKMILLAVFARKQSQGRMDERTIFVSICMAFGKWMEDTMGEDAMNYFTMAIPNNFSPRSVYNIVLYHEKRTEWLNAFALKFGPVWPEKSWWLKVWDSPLSELDTVEEDIWKHYVWASGS